MELETSVGAAYRRWGNVISLLNAEVGLATTLVKDAEVFYRPQPSTIIGS